MTEIESTREEQALEVPAPKRITRRRTEKKIVSDVTAETDTAEAVAAVAEEAKEPAITETSERQEKPAKRRTRSRKTTTKTEDTAISATLDTGEQAVLLPADNKEVSEQSAEQKKPRRRQVRTAKAEEHEERVSEDLSPVLSDFAEQAAERSEEQAEVSLAVSKEEPFVDVEAVQSDNVEDTTVQPEEDSSSQSDASSHTDEADTDEGDEGRRPRRSVKAGRVNADDQHGDQKRSKNNKKDQRSDKHDKRNKRDRNNRNKEIVPSLSLDDLTELKVADLRAKAAELELDATGLKKAELIQAVYEAILKAEGFVQVTGILDIMPDGYGFLRTQGYLPSETDCYVGLSLIRRNGLRKGDLIVGQTRPARENEKYAAIQKIITVNGKPLEEIANRVRFADLTPVYPDERLLMEHGKNTITARVIDLAAPIGKGQRGLIVSPPKAGKTTILKDIAAAISANNPEVHLMCLLVDERPEEVTDMQRSIKGEVISSTFDMPSENHIAVAELVIERAKRMVEDGRDVVILLDSLTRLARAYNLAQPASGRILSGGVDSTALYPPKRFLGAARNIEGGGSLTILASALIDTGSKMDEVIFEEFKGTGNMELKLDRYLADRRIFPAIDPVQSGTRKEDLLLNPQEAPLIWAVRRILANLNNTERAMDMLIKSLKQTDNNQEFLIRTAKKAQHNTKDEGITEF